MRVKGPWNRLPRGGGYPSPRNVQGYTRQGSEQPIYLKISLLIAGTVGPRTFKPNQTILWFYDLHSQEH